MAAKKKEARDKSHLDINAFDRYMNEDGSAKLFLLYGEEEYDVMNAVDTIKQKYIAPEAEDLDLISSDMSGRTFDPALISSYLDTPPFLSERKVVWIRQSSIFKGNYADEAKAIFSSIPDYAVLVFTLDSIDNKKINLKKYFREYGVIGQFDHSKPAALSPFAVGAVRSRGLQITDRDAISIINRCDCNKRQIISEIDKLELYCRSRGLQKIDGDSIERLCPPDITSTVFVLTDAIGGRKPDVAIKSLNSLLQRGEAPTKIRVMMARHLRMLLAAKEASNMYDLMSDLGCADFVAQNLISQSRGFTADRLAMLHIKLNDDEYQNRKAQFDEVISLESFIFFACS